MLNPARGWEVPRKSWAMQQSWNEAFFLNSSIDLDIISSLVPKGLELDTFENKAWVSLIPFKMKDVNFKYIPFFNFREFPEINLRTYVKKDNKAGVLFISLDSNHKLFNKLVRLVCNIPYIDATNSYDCSNGLRTITSSREGMSLELVAEPYGDIFLPQKGTFEYWISERYCFYNVENKKLCLWNVDHAPWPLQKAKIHKLNYNNSSLELNTKELENGALFSQGVTTRSWTPS